VKVLDTNVAVDFLRQHPPAVQAIRVAAESDVLAASEITRFELLVGLERGEEDSTEEFFSLLAMIPVGETITRRAAELARAFRSAYSGIEDADYLIAATALELDADLLTTNVRHFPMLTGLKPAY
jgi:predicted nucleic acid-binding protein